MPRACIGFNFISVFFGKNVRILHVTGSILENLVQARYRVLVVNDLYFFDPCLLFLFPSDPIQNIPILFTIFCFSFRLAPNLAFSLIYLLLSTVLLVSS